MTTVALLLLAPLALASPGAADRPRLPVPCLSSDEKALADRIGRYRGEKGLPPVPLSAKLTRVAQVHCRDLEDRKPDRRPGCNMHSWSTDGDWTGCCYTADHAQAACMWSKPRELTGYAGPGFEIAFAFSTDLSGKRRFDPSAAIESWKGSSGHDAVLLNTGIWKKHRWKAMGVGVFGGYAVVWFGDEVDAEKPGECAE